jgi:hypothetical protein
VNVRLSFQGFVEIQPRQQKRQADEEELKKSTHKRKQNKNLIFINI